jgi:hypothetical protein
MHLLHGFCDENSLSILKVYGKVVPYLTNSALRHEGVWGNGCIDPYLLVLGTSWR